MISTDREDNCKEIEEDQNEDRGKVHALRWEIYVEQKEDCINRQFWWWLCTQKGKSIETCVEDNVVRENED